MRGGRVNEGRTRRQPGDYYSFEIRDAQIIADGREDYQACQNETYNYHSRVVVPHADEHSMNGCYDWECEEEIEPEKF